MPTGIKRDNAKCIGRKIGLPPNPNQPKPVDELTREEAMQEISDIVVNSCADFDLELERAYQLLDKLTPVPVRVFVNAETIQNLFGWSEELIAKYGKPVASLNRTALEVDGCRLLTEPLYHLSAIEAAHLEHEAEIKKGVVAKIESAVKKIKETEKMLKKLKHI